MSGAGDKKKLHGFLGDLLRVGCVKVRERSYRSMTSHPVIKNSNYAYFTKPVADVTPPLYSTLLTI